MELCADFNHFASLYLYASRNVLGVQFPHAFMLDVKIQLQR